MEEMSDRTKELESPNAPKADTDSSKKRGKVAITPEERARRKKGYSRSYRERRKEEILRSEEMLREKEEMLRKNEEIFFQGRFNDLNELYSRAQAWNAENTWPLRYYIYVSHQPGEARKSFDQSKKCIELNGCNIGDRDGSKILSDVEVLKMVNCIVDLCEEDAFFSRFLIPMPHTIFFSLSRIEIINCQNIKKLFSSKWVFLNFQILVELHVEDCNSVEDIMASESEMKEEFPLPKLRSLVLRGLPELKSICGANGVLVCDSIEEIAIVDCPNLRRIPLNLQDDGQGQPSPPPSLRRICMVPLKQWSQLEWDHLKAKSLLEPYLEEIDVLFLKMFLEDLGQLSPSPLELDQPLEPHINDLFLNLDSAEPSVTLRIEEQVGLSNSELFPRWFNDLNSYAQALHAEKMGLFRYRIYVGHQPPAADESYNEMEKFIELNGCDISTDGVKILSDVEVLNIVDCTVVLCEEAAEGEVIEEEVEDEKEEEKEEAFFSRFIPLPLDIFSSLSWIQIISCQNIKKLFSSNWVLHLENLVKLRVEDCNSMEDIIASESEPKEEGISASTFILPKLRSLVLRRLPKLTSIYGANGVMVCDSIEDIVLHDCPKLKRMLNVCATYNESLRTTAANDESRNDSGKFVEVNGCNICADGIKMLSDVGKLHIFNCTVDLCEENDAFFSTFITPEPHSIFSALSRIEIIDCKNIKKLFLSDWVKQNLQNLKILCVRGCEEMEEIIASESEGTCAIKFALPKLRWLELHDLPELKSICSASGVMVCNSIEKIFIGNCPNIKRIPLDLPLRDDGRLSPPPWLRTINAYPEEWWEVVEWDHPNAKSLLQPYIENWPLL